MERKSISNTQYIIKRVFGTERTASDLIEGRIKANCSNSLPLTDNGKMMYNGNSGPIRSKEVI